MERAAVEQLLPARAVFVASAAKSVSASSNSDVSSSAGAAAMRSAKVRMLPVVMEGQP